MKIEMISPKIAASLLAAIMVLIAGQGAFAEQNQYTIDAEAAQAYADAYSARDITAMSAFLSEKAVFEDPASYFEGKGAIIDGLSEVFSRVTTTGPDTRELNKYRSGSHFVYIAWIDFNMMIAVGEQPEREFNFKLDLMMTLKVEHGKIVEHRDYLDTEAFIAQLQTQMAANKH